MTSVGALARPALGDAPGRRTDTGRPDHAVVVVDVIAHPGGRQGQRHHGGQAGAVAGGHLGAPHAAQWARSGLTARWLLGQLRLD